jgi:hypothetical protein
LLLVLKTFIIFTRQTTIGTKMLIKIINDENLEMHIEKLKSHFNVGSASKAVASAATDYFDSHETIYKQSRKISILEGKLNGIVSLLAEKRELEVHISNFLDEEIEI